MAVAASAHHTGVGWVLLGDLRLAGAATAGEAQVRQELAAVLQDQSWAWPPVKLVLLAGSLTCDASPQTFVRVTRFVTDLRGWLPGGADAALVAEPGASRPLPLQHRQGVAPCSDGA